jgi:hypothetical protein
MSAFEDYARAAVRRTLDALTGSAIFLAIFSQDYEENAVAVLQFGLAVLLDKPIYLLCPEGRHLPENVKRLARAIEYYRPDDLELVTQRLLDRARAEGHLGR